MTWFRSESFHVLISRGFPSLVTYYVLKIRPCFFFCYAFRSVELVHTMTNGWKHQSGHGSDHTLNWLHDLIRTSTRQCNEISDVGMGATKTRYYLNYVLVNLIFLFSLYSVIDREVVIQEANQSHQIDNKSQLSVSLSNPSIIIQIKSNTG